MDETQKAAKPTGVEGFLARALERWQQASDAEAPNRAKSLDDIQFSTGDQWPADIQTQRVNDGKPCLTMNRIPSFIRQVTNEQRQQRPSIKVNPVGDGADVDTADIFQGIIRHIEVQSDADIAIDTAFDMMVRGGFAYLRLVTDYCNDLTLEQELKIRRIKNPFTVYFDPTCIEPDYSDANWAFIIEDISIEDFKVRFPRSELATLTEYEGIGNMAPDWVSKHGIRIAEYFVVEKKKVTKVFFEDGDPIPKEDYLKLSDQPPITGEREVIEKEVKWYLIDCKEILEEKDWVGESIPIIPVLGDDIDVSGVRYLAGLVRHMKDPQRQYNFMVSAATEAIALAPKAPFMIAEGQQEGYEQQWKQANIRNMPYLIYKPKTLDGQLIGPPQRQNAEPPIQAMVVMLQQSDRDMKGISGLYNPSLGEGKSDQSGTAIRALQKQGDIALLNFADNLTRALKAMGRQLIDLIPKIYDAPRIQRIVKPDMNVETVGIYNSKNGGMNEEAAREQLKVKRVYDLGVGKYDITVSAGPSYQTKRQEAVASIMSLVNSYPAILPIAGDLMVRMMDWPYANEIAERMKKMLPPELKEDEAKKDPAVQAQILGQQLQQQGQVMDALTQTVNKLTDEIESKKVENDTKIQIAMMDNETKIAIEQMKAGQANLQQDHEARLAILESKLETELERVKAELAPEPVTTGGE